MKKVLTVNGNYLEYNLKIGNQKNIVLNVKSGQVNVSAPPSVCDTEIKNLIQKNIDKINFAIKKHNMNRKISLNPRDSYIIIFKKRYDIKFYKVKTKTKLTNKKLHITWEKNNEFMIKKIYKFLAVHYYSLFDAHLTKWADKMSLSYDDLVIKNMVSRWGICYPMEMKIILNIRLIHFDIKVLVYVIIHELAHLVYKNHKKEFWEYVNGFCSYYKEVKQLLKNPGV